MKMLMKLAMAMSKDELRRHLGIDRNASARDIYDAYGEAMKKHHPDRDGGDLEMAKKIREAMDKYYEKDGRGYKEKIKQQWKSRTSGNKSYGNRNKSYGSGGSNRNKSWDNKKNKTWEQENKRRKDWKSEWDQRKKEREQRMKDLNEKWKKEQEDLDKEWDKTKKDWREQDANFSSGTMYGLGTAGILGGLHIGHKSSTNKKEKERLRKMRNYSAAGSVLGGSLGYVAGKNKNFGKYKSTSQGAFLGSTLGALGGRYAA